MASEWFYTSDDKGKSGPVSSGQLQALAKSGKLKATDKVWKEGMAQWVRASTIKGLFRLGAETATPKKPQIAASTAPSTDKGRPTTRPTPEKVKKPRASDKDQEPSEQRGGRGKAIALLVAAVACVACLGGAIVVGALYLNSGAPEKILAENNEKPKEGQAAAQEKKEIPTEQPEDKAAEKKEGDDGTDKNKMPPEQPKDKGTPPDPIKDDATEKKGTPANDKTASKPLPSYLTPYQRELLERSQRGEVVGIYDPSTGIGDGAIPRKIVDKQLRKELAKATSHLRMDGPISAESFVLRPDEKTGQKRRIRVYDDGIALMETYKVGGSSKWQGWTDQGWSSPPSTLKEVRRLKLASVFSASQPPNAEGPGDRKDETIRLMALAVIGGAQKSGRGIGFTTPEEFNDLMQEAAKQLGVGKDPDLKNLLSIQPSKKEPKSAQGKEFLFVTYGSSATTLVSIRFIYNPQVSQFRLFVARIGDKEYTPLGERNAK